MNRVKKGSILMEALAAIAIVLMTITFSYKLIFMIRKSIENEEALFRVRETLNAVSNEVKYNISFKDMKELLDNKDLVFKYDNNFINELLKESLLDMPVCSSGENDCLVIKLLSENKECLEISIELKEKSKIFKLEIEKGYWMDYV